MATWSNGGGSSYRDFLGAVGSGNGAGHASSDRLRRLLGSNAALAQAGFRVQSDGRVSIERSHAPEGSFGPGFSWAFADDLARSEAMRAPIASLLSPARTSLEVSGFEQFEIAREAHRKKLFPEALAAIEKAIASYNIEWRFHLLRGVLLLGSAENRDLHDPLAAEKSFVDAARSSKIDAPHEAARSYVAAGWAAYVSGELATATTRTKDALALFPDLPEAHFQLAKISMREGSLAEGLEHLRRTIDLSPGYGVRAASDADFTRHGSALEELIAERRDKKRQEILIRFAKHSERALTDLHSAAAKTVPAIARWQAVRINDPTWGLLDFEAHRTITLEEDLREIAALLDKHGDLTKLIPDARLGVQRIEALRARGRSTPELDRILESWRSLISGPPGWRDSGWLDRGREAFAVEREVLEKTFDVELSSRTIWVWKRRRSDSLLGSWFGWTSFQRERSEVHVLVVRDGLGGRIDAAGDPEDFVKLPPGEIIFESIIDEETKRQQQAALSRGFEMSRAPVSEAQWLAVMGQSDLGHGLVRSPARSIGWLRAIEFCNALSRAAGHEEAYVISQGEVAWKGFANDGFRLPTEVEWRWAEREGSKDLTFDDHWEWCWDRFTTEPPYYSRDFTGPADGGSRTRVRRGGVRGEGLAERDDTGFRIVRTILRWE
jgi:formylglycine-generating enzyme